jgi:hypothetical protein
MQALKSKIIEPAKFVLFGFRQLFRNTKSSLMLWSESKETGPRTCRAEMQLVSNVKRDWLVLIPFTVYACLPFTIPTIPFIVARFPAVLPSVFLTDSVKASDFYLE